MFCFLEEMEERAEKRFEEREKRAREFELEMEEKRAAREEKMEENMMGIFKALLQTITPPNAYSTHSDPYMPFPPPSHYGPSTSSHYHTQHED